MKDYKTILEGVVNIINTTEKSDIGFANIYSYIGENCPELKESEDEKIRKELLKHLREVASGKSLELSTTDYERWANWVEKQGEQKPAEWNEEDERCLTNAIDACKQMSDEDYDYSQSYIDAIKWLKSIKDRVQPKQEWSEEDKEIIDYLIDYLESELDSSYTDLDKETFTKEITWLKSLRPQTTWKPSEEQMDILQKLCEHNSVVTLTKEGIEAIESLYQDLKKLK